MSIPRPNRGIAPVATTALLIAFGGVKTASAQPTPTPAEVAAPAPETSAPASPAEAHENHLTSDEQGQSPLSGAFGDDTRAWRIQKRRDALRDTQFKANFRTYYFDRDKFDGSENQSLATGGWAGLKTGYFLDRVAFGLTGYTSQPLYGDDSKDGANLLQPGQDGYSVIGEAYADIRIAEDTHLYVGRKEFDTPFIGKNDSRMTPNTFEAAAVQGRVNLGDDGATLKHGFGYFDKMKGQTSDDFDSMSQVAGASTKEGVFAAGGI